MFFERERPPFYVRPNWQPPPQLSVALENYLKQTKLKIANITFTDVKDNLSAKQRRALKTLLTNSADVARKRKR